MRQEYSNFKRNRDPSCIIIDVIFIKLLKGRLAHIYDTMDLKGRLAQIYDTAR